MKEVAKMKNKVMFKFRIGDVSPKESSFVVTSV